MGRAMTAGILTLILILLPAVAGILASYVLYRIIFCYPQKKRLAPGKLPESRMYAPWTERLKESCLLMDRMPFEKLTIRAEDDLTLQGRLYEGETGKPLILFFHGYHGGYQWDGFGFFQLFRKEGYSLFVAEQRSHGESSDRTITFGIRERKDVRKWAEHLAERFQEKTILLAGVSMGAATVMMAETEELPVNVKGIIADCGYTSPEDIIKKNIRELHFPMWPTYPLVRLGARMYGHFNMEETSAIEGVETGKLPVLFIHGDKDSVVPYAMCESLYGACRSRKKRLTVQGADHAVCSLAATNDYVQAILSFAEGLINQETTG